MREILGAHRKKPITQKSLLWNFEISISEWCVISQVTWPLGINNPFWNRFINGFITAIWKKSTFPENPIGTKKFTELLRRIGFSTNTQKVEKVGYSNLPVKYRTWQGGHGDISHFYFARQFHPNWVFFELTKCRIPVFSRDRLNLVRCVDEN